MFTSPWIRITPLDECAVDSVVLYDQNGDENYVDDISRPPTSIFSWPPPPEDDSRNTPTAAPLYIPPPGTQHIKPKPLTVETVNAAANVENVIDMVPASWLTQQSRSAPELTTVNLKEHNDLTESCSESYTSTCTTTTTTSDEYQHRMYNAQSILTQSQCFYDQSSVDLNSNYDYEVASFQQNLQQYHQQQQQQHGSFSSASTDLISFNAGRRSAQDCAESLYNTVNTCQLVEYIRSATPNPTENQGTVPTPRLPKKVEFADTVKSVDVESVIQSADLPSETTVESTASQPEAVPINAIHTFESEVQVVSTLPSSKIENPVPKEWTSLMVRALTTASPKPFQIPDVPVLPDCSDCPLECRQKCAEAAKSCNDVDIEDTCAPVDNAKDEAADTTTAEKLHPWELTESKKPPIKGFMASLLTTAPTSSVEWTKPIGVDVPMPEQTAAYFPPPISMEPIERLEPKGTRSPFCEALTVAPLRSFTPFENDVITQFEDLPKTQEEIKFVDALTTAPLEPVQKLNADLPDETETERLARIEAERLEQQAAEVRKIISATVDSQLSKNTSAFATVRGFRSVDPFKPISLASLPPSKYRSRSSSIVRTDDQAQSNACPTEIAQNHNNNSSSASRPLSASTKRPVAFPPPSGTPPKSYVQSGLQSPKVIPKYQRQWFNLPSQSPIRTPEPPELKENVPLAFVDLPHEHTDQISKPFAVQISAAASTSIVEVKSTQQSTSSSSSTTTATNSSKQQTATTSEVCHTSEKAVTAVPSLNDKRTGPITMTFQTIDEHQLTEPPRSATPSLINKPAPMIPYYQQNLVAEFCSPTSGHLFDPRTRTPSPRPDSVQSPAPGPPPNPLKIQAPRIKPLDAIDQLVGVPSIITGESARKCQINSQQSLENARVISETKKGMQIAMQCFQSTPPSVYREQCGNQTIETHSQSSQLNEAQKSNVQSSSTLQLGNTQIQRNRRVVEEYEHTQKANTVEIYKSSDGQQQRTTQTQNAQAINQNAYGKGFVARTARRLSETPQTKNTIVSYHFPHVTSPVTVSGFPIKTPPLDVSFDVIQKESFPPPIVAALPLKTQCSLATANRQCTNQSNQCALKTLSSINSVAARCNTQATSTNLNNNNTVRPITVPVNKPPLTVAPAAAAAAPINNLSAFNPIANNHQNTVVSDPSHASAGPNKGTSTNVGATTAPKRGRGVLNKSVGPGARVPQCGSCNAQIR